MIVVDPSKVIAIWDGTHGGKVIHRKIETILSNAGIEYRKEYAGRIENEIGSTGSHLLYIDMTPDAIVAKLEATKHHEYPPLPSGWWLGMRETFSWDGNKDV